MKGFRFYEELDNKGRKAEKSRGVVIAVPLQEDGRGWREIFVPGMVRTESGWTFTIECFSSVFDEPDSPVCGSQTTLAYLTKNCKRISEARARKIHPKMFEYLES